MTRRAGLGGCAAALAVVAGLSLGWTAPLQASADEAVLEGLPAVAQEVPASPDAFVTPLETTATDGAAQDVATDAADGTVDAAEGAAGSADVVDGTASSEQADDLSAPDAGDGQGDALPEGSVPEEGVQDDAASGEVGQDAAAQDGTAQDGATDADGEVAGDVSADSDEAGQPAGQEAADADEPAQAQGKDGAGAAQSAAADDPAKAKAKAKAPSSSADADKAAASKAKASAPQLAAAQQSGLVKNAKTGAWEYLSGGRVDRSFVGLAKNQWGWWFVRNGVIDGSYVGVADNQYGSWMVRNSKIDYSFTGLAKGIEGSSWLVSNGKVASTKTGMAWDDGLGWLYLKNGRFATEYTGLANNDWGTWYMRGGRLDKTYTGMAKDSGGTWRYVASGKVQPSYTGLAKNQYGWWYFSKGAIDWNYKGLAKNQYGWWYVRNGAIDRGYTGLAQNQWGTWYVNSGKIDFSFTGQYRDAATNTLYNVSKGKVTSKVAPDASAQQRSWNNRTQALSFLNYAYEKISGTTFPFGMFSLAEADSAFRPSVSSDAFNIDRLEADLKAVETYNAWRQSIGLKPQEIAPDLWVNTMVNTNYGAQNMGHNPEGETWAENLAWGANDTLSGSQHKDSNGLYGSLKLWHDEKAYYENFIKQHPQLGDPAAELIAVANLTPDRHNGEDITGSNTEKIINAQNKYYAFSSQVTQQYGADVMNNMGHYLNLLSNSSSDVAFASSAGSGYGSTAGMVWGNHLYSATTDQMRSILSEWRKTGQQGYADDVRSQARGFYDAIQKAKAGTYAEGDMTPQETIQWYGGYNAMMRSLNQSFNTWSSKLSDLVKGYPSLYRDGDDQLIK